MDTRPAADLITLAEVRSLLRVSRSSVYELMAKRGLPRPVKIGRSNRWYRHEVDAWLDAQPRAAIQVREEEPDMT